MYQEHLRTRVGPTTYLPPTDDIRINYTILLVNLISFSLPQSTYRIVVVIFGSYAWYCGGAKNLTIIVKAASCW